MKFLRWAVFVLVVWLAGVASWIAIGPAEDANQQADVGIVLGAAVYDTEPSPVFRERINHAISLKQDGRIRRLLFTGGAASPGDLTEAEVARDYAIAKGIAPRDILMETTSRTTRQNLLEARAVMQATDMQTAIIVSDPLHLQRAMQMAGGLGLAAKPGATPTSLYRSWSTQVPFLLRETYFVHHFWLFGE